MATKKLYSLNKQLLTELRTIDREKLTGTAAVTYDVMKNAYEVSLRQNERRMGLPSVLWVNAPYAVDQLFGLHIILPRVFIAQHPVTNTDELHDYIIRLESLDEAMTQIGDLLEADAKREIVPPAFALKAISSSARNFIDSDVASHPIVTALSEKLDNIEGLSVVEKTAAITKATAIVRDEVYPAFSRFADRNEALISKAGTDAGIWRVKGGAELYEIALANYGANGLTPDQIHQIGQDDVSRIHSEMDVILRARGYTQDSVGERMTALAKDTKVLYPNTDAGRAEILRDLASYVDDVMSIAPQWFGTLPPQPIEVKRIPIYEQDSSSGAYYTPPPLDGSRPGIFWINLKDTSDWPKYSLKTLVYHEGVPGHHFQASLQQDVKDMPLIRNMMFFAEYSEGWALYTEELATDMGLYENDPLGDLGRLKMELYRAARLVVDTGLHHKRWTREQAIDWMVEATGEPRPSITREIARYAVWPGQATSYKLGMIRFQKLRAKAEKELGGKFDIRKFHDAVLLDGSMPMPVLEARIDAWIKARK